MIIKLAKLLKNKKLIIVIGIIILIIMLFIVLDVKGKIMKIMYPRHYEEIISKYADEYNVDKNLIFAIIKAESNFENTAQSIKDAKGLMQLMESTAKDVANKIGLEIKSDELGEKLLEPEINIRLGTKYISILMEKYQNIEIALTAYNAGIGTVDNWIEKGILKADGSDIENIPYKETNNYVRKILRDYRIYQSFYL